MTLTLVPPPQPGTGVRDDREEPQFGHSGKWLWGNSFCSMPASVLLDIPGDQLEGTSKLPKNLLCIGHPSNIPLPNSFHVVRLFSFLGSSLVGSHFLQDVVISYLQSREHLK